MRTHLLSLCARGRQGCKHEQRGEERGVDDAGHSISVAAAAAAAAAAAFKVCASDGSHDEGEGMRELRTTGQHHLLQVTTAVKLKEQRNRFGAAAQVRHSAKGVAAAARVSLTRTSSIAGQGQRARTLQPARPDCAR